MKNKREDLLDIIKNIIPTPTPFLKTFATNSTGTNLSEKLLNDIAMEVWGMPYEYFKDSEGFKKEKKKEALVNVLESKL